MQHARDVEIKNLVGDDPQTTFFIAFINGWIIHAAWRKDGCAVIEVFISASGS